MGKFLKILRYIANLIAIMGGCLSIEQNGTPDSTRPLLGHQTEKSDFNPDQCVLSTRASNSSKVEACLPIHFDKPKGEFWKNQTKIYWNEVNSGSNSVFMKARGLVPLIVLDHRKRVVMTLKTLYYLGNKIIVSRTSTGFFMYVGGKSFRLENFDLLLKGEISERDFREDLEKNNPLDYEEIWDILTRGCTFLALYY
jgi:hypothetical protein